MCEKRRACYGEGCDTKICDDNCASGIIAAYMDEVGREEFYNQWYKNKLPARVTNAMWRYFVGKQSAAEPFVPSRDIASRGALYDVKNKSNI